jgi:transcriptional regulator with XRE-family HTH domain
MDLGAKLLNARLEAGLSQRALCGDQITRNMLSQIENGSARPSMDTLSYLANRLGKSVSYFLEDGQVSPNLETMERAREAYRQGRYREIPGILEEYHIKDRVFDPECTLLRILSLLAQAEEEAQERPGYAISLLRQIDELKNSTPYYTRELEQRRRLLLAEISDDAPALLPDDRVLWVRAEAALKQGELTQCATLLSACQDTNALRFHRLQAQLAFATQDYPKAAFHSHRVEETSPRECWSKLEACYQAMENYQMAYTYACKQRENKW